MKKNILFFVSLLLAIYCSSQNRNPNIVTFIVKDAASGETLPNTSVNAPGDLVHTVTGNGGRVKVMLPNETISFHFYNVNYKPFSLTLTFPQKDSVFTVLMEKKNEEKTIFSFRTNQTIEKTPTRTEILDKDAVEKETMRRSSHIADLMADINGVQVQQVSAVTNNKEIRLHGLPGRYTQLLRDGMPLFGGYAGSFSILQVPPLEVKQIEVVKGANSSLYGGGSVGGFINIISKKPVLGKKERYLLFNQSTLRETNVHLYLSERMGKAGYTFFTGANYQRQEDVNNDGFSDLGRTESIFIHPTFFFYPNEKNTISLGISSNYDDRKGGDMEILSGTYTNTNQFFIQNQTFRNTIDILWENTISTTDKLTVKGTTSSFNRNIGTPVFGMKAKQLSYFSEASYLKRSGKHDFIAGMNITGENLHKKTPDSTFITNYNYFAVGLFLQDDWTINSKFTIESGFRTDFHNIYKAFLLPRFSVMYKINPALTMRLGAGLGYRIPSIFVSDIDERDYRKLSPFGNPVTIKAERSQSINLDISNYRETKNGSISLNQNFFITNIQDPVIHDTLANGRIYFLNASRAVVSYGSETNFLFYHKNFELSLGYTFTDARKKYDAVHKYISLNPKDKFAGRISYKLSKRFSVLAEASYIGNQYLDNGIQSPSYLLAAAMIRYDIGHFSFVLNCENIFDYRQTNKESILIPPNTDPRFKQLWAPIDGRVANLSVKIRL